MFTWLPRQEGQKKQKQKINNPHRTADIFFSRKI